MSLISTAKDSGILFESVHSYFVYKVKYFIYMHNPWILLFQMAYRRPIFFNVFMGKLAVYDDDLHLSLLEALSLISTASHFLFLISTLI